MYKIRAMAMDCASENQRPNAPYFSTAFGSVGQETLLPPAGPRASIVASEIAFLQDFLHMSLQALRGPSALSSLALTHHNRNLAPILVLMQFADELEAVHDTAS
jgi:hypothetical protein